MNEDPTKSVSTTESDLPSRRSWSTPMVIVATVSRETQGSHTFKLTPSLADYTTGVSHVGS